jgi:hypothetical protein
MGRAVWIVLALMGLRAAPMMAGPMPLCIRVTMSANAKFVVVNDLTYDDPDETHVRKIRTSTFRVMPQVNEPNDYLHVNGPNSYWPMDTIWRVAFDFDSKDGREPIACAYTLITDDAEFLVFLNGWPVGAAMTIYRRSYEPRFPGNFSQSDHGMLVRAVPITDMLEKQPIPDFITDHTPSWFSGGDFKFSPDNRTLIHKTKSGATLLIDLATGVVKKS